MNKQKDRKIWKFVTRVVLTGSAKKLIQSPIPCQQVLVLNAGIIIGRPLQDVSIKDLSMVNPGFKSVPPQVYFEITGLASALKWCKIQNIDEEEYF